MPLLNYTTKVNPNRTVGEIQGMLATHGARSVLVDYEPGGIPAAISFILETRWGPASFRLPARIDQVHRVLERQHRQGQIDRRFTTREHAVRVAWRTIQDWTEAQMAFLEAEMVEMAEVFLPYMIGEEGRTLYQEIQDSRRMLAPPSEP